LRARWMDPGSGSFVSVDPLERLPFEPETLHKYLYAGANPVNAVDPAGLEWSLSNAMAALAVASFLTNITFAIINLFRSFFAPTPEEASELRFAAAMDTLGALLAYFGGGLGGGPSLAASGVGSLGSAAIMRADLIIGSTAFPAALVVLMSANGTGSGSGSGGSGGSSSGGGGDDITIKDPHVNVPKHNLNRLAPTWDQQKQMLIDAVRKLSNVAPKGTNPAGSFYEATVEIVNTAGQKVLTTIRWFGYPDGSKVINTAFVP